MKKVIKRGIAFFISFVMVFLSVPNESFYVWAEGEPVIGQVQVWQTYYDRQYSVKQTIITVKGANLKGINIAVSYSGTAYQPVTNKQMDENGIQQFEVNESIPKSIYIGDKEIELNKDSLPTLSGVTRRVNKGVDSLVLKGTNLDEIKKNIDEYKVYYQNLGGDVPLDFNDVTVTGDTVQTVEFDQSKITGDAGLQDIVIEKNFKYKNPIDPTFEVPVMIQKFYPKQFTLIDKIEAVDDLIMNPNRGMPGDEVQFIASKGLDQFDDVFFLRDLSDDFTHENKGTDTKHPPNQDGKQVLKTNVPAGLDQGEYYVILTNKVQPDQDPNEAVVKQMIIGKSPKYEKFTVIGAEQKIQIKTVNPEEGPDTGSKVDLTGRYFGTLNIEGFRPNDENVEVATVDGTGDTSMEIKYGTEENKTIGGTEVPSVGEYGVDKINVESATKRVKVIIGGVTKFIKKPNSDELDYAFSKSIDRVAILTQPITDVETDPIKDVIVETETVLVLTGFPNNIVIKDRAVWRGGKYGGYKFIPSTPKPEVEKVIPEKIQVDKDEDSSGYIISNEEDRMIGIYGKNFFVHQYTNDQNEKVVRYPIVVLGDNEIRLNKNEKTVTGSVYEEGNPDLYFKVFNDQGIELDGSEGYEMGTKILVKIPKDMKVNALGKASVKVINPVRNSDEAGLEGIKPNGVEFVLPSENKKPVIESVTPNVVIVEGGEEVTIVGSNFQDGVKVFIDGNEVTSINPQGDGKKITFIAPPGREGDTQIQVMNPEGGIDTHPFKYVKTYTNPKLIKFAPNKGNTGTLVVVDGENFLKPDPTAIIEDPYKLIGTRVLLEGQDINEYNKNDKKQIILAPYVAPTLSGSDALDPNKIGKILRIIDGKIKLEDYYHSMILEKKDVPGKFYTIDQNMKNKIILSNGVNDKYVVNLSDGKIKGDKEGGGVYTISVTEAGLKLINDADPTDNLELVMKTPFKIENNIIVGDRVRVVDINKLYFTVPILPGDGYYDVTIENPDMKKDSKMDSEGFYYYTQPTSKPNIEKIDPDKGSVDGGYKIKITGKRIDGRECFVDNGTEKTKVTINGVTVPEKDITVGIDGTYLEVVVPKLGVDIQQEYGTDRLTVAVVITNPDGGSASKEDGFTYIVPISHPKILKITPVEGKASGGNYVEITGDDFRFYEPYPGSGDWEMGRIYTDLNNYSIKTGKPDTGIEGPDDFTGENVDALKMKYKEKYKDIVLPVLPKVYFGSKPAEVVEFGNGYLKVIAPDGKSGPTEVYVVNNDSGISNKVNYNYQASNPKINSISPDGGKKQGRDRVEIKGQDFYESDIKVYNKVGNNYTLKDISQVLVRFGEITNKNIPREEENSGRIDNSRTSVQLDGGLSVDYNGVDNTLKLSIIENQQTYSVTLPYNDEIVYVPVSLLTYIDSAGEIQSYVNANRGDEWIRFEVSDRRLFIERGYSPKVEYINSGQIVVHTPSYYTVGVVPVTVINPDGGEISTNFEYKNPDSNPKITNITKDGKNPVLERIDEKQVRLQKVSYKGGNIISIIGSDFREGATIKIGDVLTINPSDITYQLPNKLTFTMPSVGEENVGKLFRVIVSNEDYGNAASDELTPPIYIQFTKGETGPSIESVTPDKGPSSGGTTVIIRGKDFREGASVYIGEMMVPKENVKLIDYKTIKIITPPHEPGTFEVVVENPDGERSNPTGTYTYLSAPQIVCVVDPKDPTETSIIDTISVEGGEEIKIKGSGFIEGARVVFVPSIEKEGEEESEGELIYIKGEPYKLLEGTDAAEVQFIDEGTLIVKTPSGKLDTKGIMVINPDTGATDIYENIKYGLPELPTPAGVVAEIMYDKYIKVTWNEVEDAQEYEIYVVVNDRVKEFVGSTELNHFVYEDLEPKTRYKFVVTAVGKFGGSKYSMESNEVKTGSTVGPDDNDGELGEKTEIERRGNLVNVIIGEDDYDENLDIDLTRGDLAGAKEVTISIPSYVAARYDAKDINIIGSDFNIKMNPKSFYSQKVRENKDKKDSGVRFSIKPSQSMSSGNSLSNGYELKTFIYVGKNSTPMDYLPSYVQITLDVDRQKADLRRMKNIYLAHYDEETRQWLPIANGNSGSYAITGLSQNLGRFSIMGSRR